MDNLDKKIDSLIRDQLFSLIQENAARIKRINIRYTKNNKKHTLEHWQVFYDSYDKVFRGMPRNMLRAEREIRMKFVSPMSEERVFQLRTLINSEAEMLFHKLTAECQSEFKKLGHSDVFEERLEKSRKKFSESLEQNIQKCLDSVNGETGKGQTGIQDLLETYGLNESTLHEINIVAPLFRINYLIGQVNGDTQLAGILDELKNGFRFLFQDIQKHSLNDVASKDARKKLKMEIARDALTVREIILNAQPLLEQMVLPDEKKNLDIVKKSWLILLEVIERQGERWETVIPGFKSLYNYLSGEEG